MGHFVVRTAPSNTLIGDGLDGLAVPIAIDELRSGGAEICSRRSN